MQSVNIDSYSTSSDFIGYSESCSLQNGKEVLDVFLDFFEGEFDKCILLCSVTQNIIKEEFFTNDEKENINHLIRIGWIKPDKEAEEIQKEFDCYNVENNDIDSLHKLCNLVFNGCTYGHVFFMWKEHELIVYPHDDVGFGVFAPLKTIGESIGLDFLKEIKKNRLFEVSIVR
ncbi:MAG: hypothetical protein D3921_14085 [Candidatus Electrothrix sp. AW1]|nr:hypothetical protein [Candidatus Electrothrix gigas]